MAVLKRVLTDFALKALKPAPKGKRPILWDADVRGLGVRYNDRKPPDRSFVLVARYPGSKNPAPRTIGDFPSMDLAEARRIAREWREDLRQGIATLATKPRPPDATLRPPKGSLSASRRTPSRRHGPPTSKSARATATAAIARSTWWTA
jgi:hypothetical protein